MGGTCISALGLVVDDSFSRGASLRRVVCARPRGHAFRSNDGGYLSDSSSVRLIWMNGSDGFGSLPRRARWSVGCGGGGALHYTLRPKTPENIAHLVPDRLLVRR